MHIEHLKLYDFLFLFPKNKIHHAENPIHMFITARSGSSGIVGLSVRFNWIILCLRCHKFSTCTHLVSRHSKPLRILSSKFSKYNTTRQHFFYCYITLNILSPKHNTIIYFIIHCLWHGAKINKTIPAYSNIYVHA